MDVGGMLVPLVVAENRIVVVYGRMVVLVLEAVWTIVLKEHVERNVKTLVIRIVLNNVLMLVVLSVKQIVTRVVPLLLVRPQVG